MLIRRYCDLTIESVNYDVTSENDSDGSDGGDGSRDSASDINDNNTY
jgi:hypothetical protein